VCASTEHFAAKCPNPKGNDSANMVISEPEGILGYGNLLPTVFQFFVHLNGGLTLVLIFIFVLMLLCFLLTRTAGLPLADGARIACACFWCWYGKSEVYFGEIVQLKNVQHVPTIKKNLVSGSLLCRDGLKLVFESNKCILSKFGTFVGKDYESGGLFRLSLSDVCNKVAYNVINVDETNIWHSRLCHVNFGCMMRLANLSLISKFTFVKNSKCHECVESKQTRKPHKAAEARNLAPLELIHSDLCEMNGMLTKGGKKYFMTLIDDSTRFCYIYLLKSKDETLHYFKIYKGEVENQLERKIKRVRSDRGGEYFSNLFTLFCEEHGIIHERTPPYSPQSNGVAERKNRTLTDLVDAMLDTAGLSKEWWGEAILTACHVLNRVPTKNKEITPFEEWEKKRPTLSYLRTEASPHQGDLKVMLYQSQEADNTFITSDGTSPYNSSR
jgi:transposase InsO family protein